MAGAQHAAQVRATGAHRLCDVLWEPLSSQASPTGARAPPRPALGLRHAWLQRVWFPIASCKPASWTRPECPKAPMAIGTCPLWGTHVQLSQLVSQLIISLPPRGPAELPELGLPPSPPQGSAPGGGTLIWRPVLEGTRCPSISLASPRENGSVPPPKVWSRLPARSPGQRGTFKIKAVV